MGSVDDSTRKRLFNRHSGRNCPCICHKRFGQSDKLTECVIVTGLGKEGSSKDIDIDEYDKDFCTDDDAPEISRWFLQPYEHYQRQSGPRAQQNEIDENNQGSGIPIGLEAIIYQQQVCRCGFRKHLLKTIPFFSLRRENELSKPFLDYQQLSKSDIENPSSNYDIKKDLQCSCIPPPSPYGHKFLLAKLQELKEEERNLLHTRRIMEVDRLSGPLPKWYEGKDKHFHDESHFNTFTLKCPKMWKEFVKVREDTLSLLFSDIGKQYHNGFRRYRLISQNSI